MKLVLFAQHAQKMCSMNKLNFFSVVSNAFISSRWSCLQAKHMIVMYANFVLPD